MSEETVKLLFESDITANVDTKDAEEALGKLQKAVTDLSKNIVGAFSSVSNVVQSVQKRTDELIISVEGATAVISKMQDQLAQSGQKSTQATQEQSNALEDLKEQISDLRDESARYRRDAEDGWRMVSTLRDQIRDLKSETEKPPDEESFLEGFLKDTQDAAKEMDLLSLTVVSLMSRFSREIKAKGPEPGTFNAFESIKRDAASAVDQLRVAGIDIKQHTGEISQIIQDWAERIALGARKQNLTAELIIKAWQELFDILIGHSILPELLKGYDKYLVEEAEKVFKEHADLIRRYLKAEYDIDPQKLLEPYRLILKQMSEDQRRFADDASRDMLTAAEAAIKVLGPALVDMRAYLLKFRDISQWPANLNIRQITARMQREGITMLEVMKQVDAAMGNVGRSSLTLTQQVGKSTDNLVLSFLKARNAIDSFAQDSLQALKDLPLRIGVAFDALPQKVVEVASKLYGSLRQTLNEGVRKALDVIPLQVRFRARDLIAAFAETGERLGISLQTAATMPAKDAVKQIIDSFTPLTNTLGDIGSEAGRYLVDRLKEQIAISTPIVVNKVTDLARQTGEALESQFLYHMGKIGDILSFRGKGEKLLRREKRAEMLGMERTFERLHKARVQLGYELDTIEEKSDYAMRQVEIRTRDALGEVGIAFANATSSVLRGGDAWAGFSTAIGHVGQSLGLFTDKAENIDQKLAKVTMRINRVLGSYKEAPEQMDKGLLRLGTRIDALAQLTKTQQQEYQKLAEAARRGVKEQEQAYIPLVRAVDNYTDAVNEAEDEQEQAYKDAADQIKQVIVQMGKLGLAPEGFNVAVYEQVNALRELIKAYQELAAKRQEQQADPSIDIGPYEAARDAAKQHAAATGVAAMEVLDDLDQVEDKYEELAKTITTQNDTARQSLKKLHGDSEAMVKFYPKQLSMLNRAREDFVSNMKHWLTTVRDEGKISTERLQDLRWAVEQYQRQVGEARKLGVFDVPGIQKYWKQMHANTLQQIELFLLLSQRSQVVKARQEEIAAAAKKVGSAFLDAGRKIIDHIPLIGRATRATKEDMDRLRDAGGRAGDAFRGVSFSLGELSPVFSDLTMGSSQMGDTFRGVMESMHQAAQVKGASIVKTLTMIKIAAAALIAVFAGLIISTGRVAAEVTTLDITMRTVAKNTGYNIKEIERWREVLKDAGITTREATSALTQFMRARLPTEWSDPITEATYNIEDLARAAQQIAVTMGEDSSATFARFIDFIQTGNSQLLNEVGIMKNANQMLEEHAKAIGVNVKAMSEQQRKLALINGLMHEATAVEGVYTEAMKTASKQLGSMKRFWEELRLEWGKQFEPILALVIRRFNELLQLLTKIPDETKQTVAVFVTITTAISGLALALATIGPKLNIVFGGLRLLVGLLFGKFGILIAIVGAAIAALGKFFFKIKTEEKGVAGITDRIDQLIDGFKGIKNELQPVINWLRNFFGMVKSHIDGIVVRIRVFIIKLRQRIEAFAEEHPEIVTWFKRVKEIIGDLFTVVWKVVDRVLGAVEMLLDQNWQGFFDKLSEAGRMIIAWLAEFFSEVVVQAFEWGKNIISAFVNGFVTFARTAIPRAMSGIGDLIALFLEGHSPAASGPLSKIDVWGEGIMSGFERGLRRKKILFDEDMFAGFSGLRAKARFWGDNIVDVFATGITGKAARAIIPAMDTVGSLIARFLEGHSPPIEGRLAQIEDWGRNAFETFLLGFEMADFSILDKALSLVQTRIQNLVDNIKDAGGQVAAAMMQVRTVVSQAIFQARATGGPLDLSGLQTLLVGSLQIYAQDIATVLEAMFAALQAQEAYQALQASIEAARAARQDAIRAAEDRLRGIQDEIKGIEDEIKDLEDQMEAEIQTRLEAAGLLIDERLTKQLQRDLERANVDIQRAQRRLQGVRDAAGAYGVNILTWEEINAQAQLDMAERRRDEIQEQINIQDELQRQADEIRDAITAQYEAQFEVLRAQLEAAQERAEAAQNHLEEIRRADQDATRAENAQLAAAQRHAAELAAHADLLSKLLEERMNAEKDLADMIGEGAGTQGKTSDATKKANKARFDMLMAIEEMIENTPTGVREPKWSEKLEEWLNKVDLSLEGGIAGLVAGIGDKIEAWWGDFLSTPLGQFFEGLGVADLIETTVREIGEVIDSIVEAWNNLMDVLDLPPGIGMGLIEDGIKGIGMIIRGVAAAIEALIVLLSEGMQFVANFISAIITGDWSSIVEGVGETIGEILDAFDIDPDMFIENFLKPIQRGMEKFLDGLSDIGDDISGFFDDIASIGEEFGRKITETIQGIIDTIIKFFEDLWYELTGGSIIPDMVDDIVDWIASIPGKIIGVASDLFRAAVELGGEVYDGFKEEINRIIDGVTGWFKDNIGGNILSAGPDLLASAITVGGDVFSGFKGKIDDAINGVADWFRNIGSNIAGTAPELGSDSQEVGSSVYSGFYGEVEAVINNVASWFRTTGSNIASTATDLWYKAQTVGQNVHDGFKGKVDEVKNNVAGWFQSVGDEIKSEGVLGYLYSAASALANKVFTAFNEMIFGEDGLWDKLPDWMKGIANWLKEAGSGVVEAFQTAGDWLSQKLMGAISAGVNLYGDFLQTIKNWWNWTLREPFEDVINFVVSGINGIIGMLNAAWRAIGSPGWLTMFPIDELGPVHLPEMQLGGITTQDVIAQLHAGEVVIPLDRLVPLLRDAISYNDRPVFAPTMIFQGGATPQQIGPAVSDAFDLYRDYIARKA